MPAQEFIKRKPAYNRLNLVGQRFGRLLVTAPAGLRLPKRFYWECLCDCGTVCFKSTGNLRSAGTESCGCLQFRTHGHSHTPLYNCWYAMNKRCFDPKDGGYKHYGARRITVCKGWQSVENFAADMGAPPKGLTIDRINNDGGYWCGHCEECIANNWPKNCRWETPTTQNRNKSNNHPITANGKTMLLVEWSQETGLPKNTILNRLNRGWTEEDAISKPVDTSKRRKVNQQ